MKLVKPVENNQRIDERAPIAMSLHEAIGLMRSSSRNYSNHNHLFFN